MEAFDFLVPANLQHLTTLLQTPGRKLIAGGTDLIPSLRQNQNAPSQIIDISRLREMRYIREQNRIVHIGALTSFRDIQNSRILNETAPALVQAAGQIGSPMIRTRGTLGGNLANASPAADSLPALLIMDASVTLSSQNGQRTQKLQEFLLSPGKTDLHSDEILTDIFFEKPPINCAASFMKIGPRRGMTIAIVNAAALLGLDSDGCINQVRLSIGAAAPTAIRCLHTEQALIGKQPSEQLWESVSSLIIEEISPIDDIRGTAQYRRRAAFVLAKRALSAAVHSLQTRMQP
jgi:CO/xanthine dehydrogenase FAD-binding subunit